MINKENGGPAFPAPDAARARFGETESDAFMGMTLRDYFAAKAMGGMVANIVRGHVSYGNTRDMAARCYEIADEMLVERAK